MPDIFLKSILRQPVKLTVLVILLVAASFATALRVAEYQAITQEISRIESFYTTIGYVWPANAPNAPPSVQQWLDQLRAMQSANTDSISPTPELRLNLNFSDYTWQNAIYYDERVAFVDTRRRANAALTNITNANILGTNATSRLEHGQYGQDVIFLATLNKVSGTWSIPENMDPERAPMPLVKDYLVMNMIVQEVIVGQPEHAQEGWSVNILVPVVDGTNAETYHMSIGNTYLLRAWHDNLARITNDTHTLVLSPLHINGNVYFVDTNSAEFYGKLQGLGDVIENISRSQHAVHIVSTIDASMSHVKHSDSVFRLISGRWPTYQDHIESTPVVAIHVDFARSRGLSVNDTIQISPLPLGVANSTPVDFEIIGLYSTNDILFGINDFYMPTSLAAEIFYPSFVVSTILDSAFSFALHSPRYRDEFFRDVGPPLFAMGYVLVFIPTNFELFTYVADPIAQTLRINLVIFCMSAIAVLLITATIYLRLASRNIAMCRALGMQRNAVFAKAILPLALIALPTTAAGATAAWHIAAYQTAQSLALLYEIEPHLQRTQGSISPLVTSLVVAIMVVVFVCITGVFVWQRLRKPVLRLLQGS